MHVYTASNEVNWQAMVNWVIFLDTSSIIRVMRALPCTIISSAVYTNVSNASRSSAGLDSMNWCRHTGSAWGTGHIFSTDWSSTHLLREASMVLLAVYLKVKNERTSFLITLVLRILVTLSGWSSSWSSNTRTTVSKSIFWPKTSNWHRLSTLDLSNLERLPKSPLFKQEAKFCGKDNSVWHFPYSGNRNAVDMKLELLFLLESWPFVCRLIGEAVILLLAVLSSNLAIPTVTRILWLSIVVIAGSLPLQRRWTTPKEEQCSDRSGTFCLKLTYFS